MAHELWIIETLRLLFLFGGLVLTFYLAQRRESKQRLDGIEERLRVVEKMIERLTGRMEGQREREAKDIMDTISQVMSGNRSDP